MELKPTHRIFCWLAGLYGVVTMFYGVLALPQAWHRAAAGTDHGAPDEPPDLMTELHHIYHIFWSTKLVPACVLLVIAGLVILMLTYPRRPKAPPSAKPAKH